MAHSHRDYIPAAGCDLFLPFYDFITKLIGGDEARRALLDLAELKPGQRVLDIGCGTGSLAIHIRLRNPDIEVVGLDPDPKALGRARRKAERAGAAIQFDVGFSNTLPYPDASFDRVLSSFMFHHLQRDQKEKTLREVSRVLKPRGYLLLLDFDLSGSSKEQGLSRLVRSHQHIRENVESRIIAFMSQAGFSDVSKIEDRVLLFGLAHIGYYTASVP